MAHYKRSTLLLFYESHFRNDENITFLLYFPIFDTPLMMSQVQVNLEHASVRFKVLIQLNYWYQVGVCSLFTFWQSAEETQAKK